MASSNSVVLGVGTTGTVSKEWVNGRFVARKTFNRREYYEQEKSIYESIRAMQHKNLVELFAMGPKSLDLELVNGGSLLKAMNDPILYSQITPINITKILVGCLLGLDFFHKIIKKVHFDIKPDNIR